MIQRDYYQALGVARNASPAAIRAAFTRLAKSHHPDVVGGSGELPWRLQEVQRAYRCLSDAEARAGHDRALHDQERLHSERQREVRRRLRHYDRLHPQLTPSPNRIWGRSVVKGAMVAAVIAAIWLGLLG